MKQSRKVNLLKCLVYVYAVVLGVTGIAQIILGTVIIWDHLIFTWLADNEFWKPSTLLICVGPFSLLLCWLVLTSTFKENRRILIFFTFLLITSIIVQITTCIWSVKLRWTLTPRSSQLEFSIDDSFGQFFIGNSLFDSSHIWNKVQALYKCCGVDGHTDYRRGAVPWSCFEGSEMNTDTTKLHQRGCLQVLEVTIRRLLLYCAFSALVSSLLQSVGIFCTIQLILSLGEKSEEAPNVDLATMSFREKRAHIEMLQPLSTIKGTNRKKFLNDNNTKMGTINSS